MVCPPSFSNPLVCPLVVSFLSPWFIPLVCPLVPLVCPLVPLVCRLFPCLTHGLSPRLTPICTYFAPKLALICPLFPPLITSCLNLNDKCIQVLVHNLKELELLIILNQKFCAEIAHGVSSKNRLQKYFLVTF